MLIDIGTLLTSASKLRVLLPLLTRPALYERYS